MPSTMSSRQFRAAVFIPRPELRGGGDKMALTIAQVLGAFGEVTVVTEVLNDPAELHEIGRFHNLDLRACRLLGLPRGRSLLTRMAYRSQAPQDVLYRLQDWENNRTLRREGYDLFVNMASESQLTNPGHRGVYVCMFPPVPDRPMLQTGTSGRIWRLAVRRLGGRDPHLGRSYDRVLPISTFTAEWLRRWWGIDSPLCLYPPCEDLARFGVERRRMILNVGRFFANTGDSHHKRQDILLDAFAEMTDLHDQGWELVFVGAVHDAGESAEFVRALRERARGLPVRILTAVDHAELATLMNQATIYWHGTGYGTDLNAQPGRQEHFGISTVEAMSAGAVAVVYAGAGARDTVEEGVTGLTWNTVEELQAQTRSIAADPVGLASMSAAGRRAAARFGRDAFRRTLTDVVAQLL